MVRKFGPRGQRALGSVVSKVWQQILGSEFRQRGLMAGSGSAVGRRVQLVTEAESEACVDMNHRGQRVLAANRGSVE